MKLYEQWKDRAYKEMPEAEYNAFWTDYLEKEKKNYEYILENHTTVISGSLKELAEKFNMETVEFAGFMDGIETSLVNTVDLDSLTEDSEIKLEVDLEKLYFNMLDAKADWLYNLPQWDAILTEEKRKEIKKEYGRSKTVVKEKKIGRNDPCPCGSGLKYKKCCGKN